MSLPSRERGLKYVPFAQMYNLYNVAPLAGARIEICCSMYSTISGGVAPLAGARIEIED